MRLLFLLVIFAPLSAPFGIGDIIPLARTRVKKNGESSEFLEQCEIVDAWREQPGFVNVLAFLDSSWPFSHRQAVMLNLLQGRLKKTNITDVRFFVVNSAKKGVVPEEYAKEEKEAWIGVFPKEAEFIPEIKSPLEELANATGPEIPIVQDDDKLRIWERLHVSRDQILVIDRCGRLSYQVMVPWSILHFPYVKAAILSTYNEQPCGECDLRPLEESLLTETQTERILANSDNFNITKMRELAGRKYNLEEHFDERTKPHTHKDFEDMPDSILKLLNDTVGMKRDEKKLGAEKNSTNVTEMSTGVSIFENGYVNSFIDLASENEAQRSNESHGIFNDFAEEVKKSEEARNETLVEEKIKTEEIGSSTDFPRGEDGGKTLPMIERGDIDSDEGLKENHISREEGSSGKEASMERSQNADYVIPIRIIMRAPHLHEYGYLIRRHEYLVLKTDQPGCHEHLNSGEEVASTDGDKKKNEDEDEETNNNSYENTNRRKIVANKKNDEDEDELNKKNEDDQSKQTRDYKENDEAESWEVNENEEERGKEKTTSEEIPNIHKHKKKHHKHKFDDQIKKMDESDEEYKKNKKNKYNSKEDNEAESWEINDNDEKHTKEKSATEKIRKHKKNHKQKFDDQINKMDENEEEYKKNKKNKVNSKENNEADSWEINDNDEKHSKEVFATEKIHKHKKHHEQKIDDQIYERDETPGFYGEALVHFDHLGVEESRKKIVEFQGDKDEQYIKIDDNGKKTEYDIEKLKKKEHPSINIETDDDGKPAKIEMGEESIIERIEGRENIRKTGGRVVESVEEVVKATDLVVDEESYDYDEREEEMRNKLMNHYSKLLPWIRYTLKE